MLVGMLLCGILKPDHLPGRKPRALIADDGIELADALRQPLATVEEALVVQQSWAQDQVEEWVINLREGHVSLVGKLLKLTALEERLLACLVRRRGQVVSYDELWREGWGYDGSLDKGVIQRAMSRLRKKMGHGWIVCVRGRGYRLR